MESAEKQSIFSKDLIKSKKRVADHGEVFTPSWLIEAMLDMTKESDRIEARFLEPACGDGNFLTHILKRKLAIVEVKCRNSIMKKDFALISLMSIYGVELLQDNIIECRRRMIDMFASFLKLSSTDIYYKAANHILSLNIIHGDALKMTTFTGRKIIFSEWEYLSKGKFRRKDFYLDTLTHTSNLEGNKADPIKIHSPMTVEELIQPIKGKLREVSL